MYLNIDKQVFDQYPDLKIGAIVIKNLNNTKRISTVESLLRGICAQREKEFAQKDIDEDPMIMAWNKGYGRFGVNPNKYSPSIRALLKRVQSGKEIPHINALVDLYNYFSLKHLMPIGGEDLDWLCGDLNLTYTKGGEAFRSMGSIEVDHANPGEVAYIDDGGITCRYWNHRECERTKFTQKTVNAVILVEDLSKMHMDEFGKVMQEIKMGMTKYIGGEIETHILTDDNSSIDLGVAGRKNADDSRIPQQEKAYFIEEVLKKNPGNQLEKVSTPTIQNEKSLTSIKKTSLVDSSLLEEKLKTLVLRALYKAYERDFPDLKIDYPNDDSHGDYATNVALHLTKELNLPPREIAQKISDSIEKNELIEKTDIAGPGFINFFISKKQLEENLNEILEQKDKYGSSNIGDGKNIIAEFSSPNIAKPLGVHHLLSTIIGQTLSNIYQFLGFKVTNINHIGDWGTQFGKLTYAYKQWGNREVIETSPIDELLKLYVKFHDESEKDSTLEEKARAEFKKLEDGDEENRKLWEWFCKVSLEEVQKTYDFLGGIHFDHIQGESFYNDKMGELLEHGKKEKVFTEGKEGSVIVEFEDDKYPPYLVQKSDGATLYSTRDIAAINYREETWHPEKILYAVDVAQSLHFQQLFEVSRLLKLTDSELVHVVFGRMQFKDSKMSTRKGNIVLLDEVLEEAVKKAENVVEEKNRDLDEATKKDVGHKIGVGALKYTILAQNRITNITFDWDKMLSLEGNSAPYLQYSYARAKSILRKALISNAEEQTEDDGKEDLEAIEARTSAILRFLPKFKEYILRSADEYKPNIITNYLWELSQKFNSFYNQVPVLKAKKEDKEARLKIVEAVSQVLKNGLLLLGVEVVEEM